MAASEEDLLNPPYPDAAVTADGLFGHLRALRKWVTRYRDPLNELIEQDVIPKVRPIPDRAAYLTQPVLVQWAHMLQLRNIRECWDHLVRQYEDDWDDRLCLQQRIMLVQSAAVVLNDAFVPQEVREIRRKKQKEEMRRTFDDIARTIDEALNPKHSADPDHGKKADDEK